MLLSVQVTGGRGRHRRPVREHRRVGDARRDPGHHPDDARRRRPRPDPGRHRRAGAGHLPADRRTEPAVPVGRGDRHEGRARRQLVAHDHRVGVGRAVVGDGQVEGHGVAGVDHTRPHRLLGDGDVGLVAHRHRVAVGVVLRHRVAGRAGDVGEVGDRARARRGQHEQPHGDRRGVGARGERRAARAGDQPGILAARPAGPGRGDVRRARRDGIRDDDGAERARGSVVRDLQGPVEGLPGHRGPGVGLGDREVHDGVDVGDVRVDVVGEVGVLRRRRHPGRVREGRPREVEVGVDVDDDLQHGPVTRGQRARTGRR